MSGIGETAGSGEPLSMRAVERYGGREQVGSVLWLEHVDSISFTDESGESKLLLPKDLKRDEETLTGNPINELNLAYSQDAALVMKERWLRGIILPTLPLRITGDRSQPPLKFDADLKVFRVPRELARHTGVIMEQRQIVVDGEIDHDLNEDSSISFSLRFVPSQGQVERYAIYPGYSDADYGITAVEDTPDVLKVGVGYQKYFEVYKRPQLNELPPLLAPHQF